VVILNYDSALHFGLGFEQSELKMLSPQRTQSFIPPIPRFFPPLPTRNVMKIHFDYPFNDIMQCLRKSQLFTTWNQDIGKVIRHESNEIEESTLQSIIKTVWEHHLQMLEKKFQHLI
jgi:hypothetical protein